MILYLPKDVEIYILDFLIDGYSIQNLSIICKNWKNIIEKSFYKKTERNLYNEIGILLEENTDNLNDYYLIIKNGQLAGMGAHSYSKGSATGGSEEAAKYKKK